MKVGYINVLKAYRKGKSPIWLGNTILRVQRSEAWQSVTKGFYKCPVDGTKSSSDFSFGGFQWPHMLVHYIRKHDYLPPSTFILRMKKEKIKKDNFVPKKKEQLPSALMYKGQKYQRVAWGEVYNRYVRMKNREIKKYVDSKASRNPAKIIKHGGGLYVRVDVIALVKRYLVKEKADRFLHRGY